MPTVASGTPRSTTVPSCGLLDSSATATTPNATSEPVALGMISKTSPMW
ncbi:MAG TPA: hypothetical protein VGH72_24025 [Pseudonocardia sp.]|jgi:hypothetical protein